MPKFEFQEFDAIGEETLEAIGQADHFNRWMYQTIKPWCKGQILEIGSGAGNISRYFLEDESKIMLSDIRENYCQKLNEKFIDKKGLLSVTKMNLTDPDFDSKHRDIFNSFDTVFALNVVEHIEDDFHAIKNSYKLLKQGGHLIILVPAYQSLYNQFDLGLGHYRRYTRSSLARIFHMNNLKIIRKQYFNFVGLFGWFFSGSILKKEQVPVGQIKIFNSMVPIFKVFDMAIFHSIGLSTIVVGKKQ